MIYLLLRRAPPSEAARTRPLQRHRLPRGAAAATVLVALRSTNQRASGHARRPSNVRIEGGERIRDIRRARPSAPRARSETHVAPWWSVAEPRRLLALHAAAGCRTQRRRPSARGFDPSLSAVDFSFKVECPTEFDCRDGARLPAGPPSSEPEIDYLAKDYASFRRLMLDRLAALMPAVARAQSGGSRRRAGRAARVRRRLLSYQQDAVATEAYSARRAGGSRCAATHGWSITSCTTAATPAPGCRSRSTRSSSAGFQPGHRML